MEIVLIRHGRPASAVNHRVNAAQYRQWIAHYDASLVADDSRPLRVDAALNQAFLVSSDLPRARHSCEIYTSRQPDLSLPLYREMEIPHYPLPLNVRAMTWVYLCRAIWMLGKSGPFESFSQAKQRAEIAAKGLAKLAAKEGKVVLFGHAVLHMYIRKALCRQGWQRQEKSNDYWGLSRLLR